MKDTVSGECCQGRWIRQRERRCRLEKCNIQPMTKYFTVGRGWMSSRTYDVGLEVPVPVIPKETEGEHHGSSGFLKLAAHQRDRGDGTPVFTRPALCGLVRVTEVRSLSHPRWRWFGTRRTSVIRKGSDGPVNMEKAFKVAEIVTDWTVQDPPSTVDTAQPE